MTACTPDLCDEVLVLRGPHAGGVGTVTDIDEARGFRVDGTLGDGKDFTRWTHPDDLTPAEWGTWQVAMTLTSGVEVVSTMYTDQPIEPVEMVVDPLTAEAKWYVMETSNSRGPYKVAINVEHIETVEVIVIARRDSR